MIRTRNFFLFLVIVVFLLVAIGATIFSKHSVATENTSELSFVTGEAPQYGAEVSTNIEDQRADRLAAIKKKIAAGAELFIDNTFFEGDDLEPDEPKETEVVETAVEQRCANYGSYVGVWNPVGVTIRESEGARLVYRTNINQTGTSSPSPAMEREVLLTLPLLSTPSGSGNCISSDVVGLTVGGTLIRNTDVSTYASFGENMLIGYALDGFPIYGPTAAGLDACGGRQVGVQYRYQVAPERNSIIQCYSAQPTRL